MRNLTRILNVLVLSMLVPFATQYAVGQPPMPNRGKPQNTQPPTPLASAANKAAQDAKASADKADAAKKAVADANDAVRAAQKEVDEAAKAVKKIEDDTIDAQPNDSEIGKARDAYRAAEKKYQEARTSVLEDPSFKDRLTEAKEADDGGASLRALRKEFDDMPAISDPRAAMQSAKEAFEPLKTKLLGGTDDWVKANDELKSKKSALDDAKHKYSDAFAAANKAKAAAARDKAAAQAAAARAAQGQPVMSRMGRRGG